jgi:hypothetical protein
MNIDKFGQALIGGGVKPSQFVVVGNIPFSTNVNAPVSFLCKSASLPGSRIGNINVGWRGRQLKVPGDRTFDDWTLTFYNTTTFDVRKAFENWIEQMQSTVGNVPTEAGLNFAPGSQTPYADWRVTQLGRANEELQTYYLKGCFPTEVSAIDLSYDNQDQIEEFTVNLSYQYFTIGPANNGDGSIGA